ncbi:MAG TPA: iron-sulfur cluster carrier protein ApbC [Bacteroidetes bacterium]|nr:iron-sulfur cluster carrier protein ApbC [Bacteroidota bacterium]
MQIEKQQIVEALYTVIDPNSGKDIIKARMVEQLQVEGNNVNFNLNLPSLNGPNKQNLIFACVGAVKGVYPDAEVNVHVVTKAPNAQASTSPLSQVKNIIAVASGKGGVGKSTVAVNLALGLKKLGAKVGIIDADLYGPSIPTMLGLQGKRPKVVDVDGKPKIIPLMAYDMPVMSIGFIIEPQQAVVLRGPRLAAIIKQFFNDVQWTELDYLIVDLPPGTGDIQLTMVQTVPVTGAIMVTTPQEVAVADAIKAMNMFLMPSVNVPILGVVENMSWFTPDDMPDKKYYLFGEGGGQKLATIGECSLLGQVPLVQGVREGGDAGQPIVTKPGAIVAKAFMKVAENAAQQITVRNDNMGATKVVQIVHQ